MSHRNVIIAKRRFRRAPAICYETQRDFAEREISSLHVDLSAFSFVLNVRLTICPNLLEPLLLRTLSGNRSRESGPS